MNKRAAHSAKPILSLSEVVGRLTPEGILGIWRRTWGVGGPHNKGPVNVRLLGEISLRLRAMPENTPPWVAAGAALYGITYRRPFWDCNKRTGWSVCDTIMLSTGFALAASDKEVEEVVLGVENGTYTEDETIEAVRTLFSRYRAKSS